MRHEFTFNPINSNSNFLTLGTPESWAVFSPCRTWRYALLRKLEIKNGIDNGTIAFVGLNPSTADEKTNDPTVRRCITYATDWGFGAFIMLNLFAFRATDPKDMKAAADPVGPDNNGALSMITSKADMVIVAWGNDGAYRDRSAEVMQHVISRRPVYHLGLNSSGEPKHPLYLKRNLNPTEMRQ